MLKLASVLNLRSETLIQWWSLTNVDIFRNYKSLKMYCAIRNVYLTCLYQMLVVML